VTTTRRDVPAAAAGFYRHIGFTEFPATEAELPAPGLHLFGMDLQATS
jgi:hypothetical protein